MLYYMDRNYHEFNDWFQLKLDKEASHDSELQAIEREPVPLEKVDGKQIKTLRSNATGGKTLPKGSMQSGRLIRPGAVAQ